MRKSFTIGLIILISALLFFLQLSVKERDRSVTALSSGPEGLSMFLEISKRLGKGQVQLLKQPLLTEKIFEGKELLMLLSPLTEVSSREAKIIAEFVKNGGDVFLAFHNEPSKKNLESLFLALQIAVSTEEDISFENGKAISVSSKADTFTANGNQLSFYSNMVLSNDSCPGRLEECYEKEFAVGKGKVFVVSGIPPFANALLHRDDNSKMAFGLLRSYRSILIDEYHHQFTDKTGWDLFLEPTFFFPIVGLVIVSLIYFLFGKVSVEELTNRTKEVEPARPYHAFNERALAGLTEKIRSKSDLVVAHANFLKKIFPHEQSSIDGILRDGKERAWDENARLLALFHTEILQKRGKL